MGHGFDVLDHLDRHLEIPVHAGLQAQGDLFIIPADPNRSSRQGAAVPPDGIAVIEGVNGGHEHRLFAGQPGTAFFTAAGASGQDIGLRRGLIAAWEIRLSRLGRRLQRKYPPIQSTGDLLALT